MKKLFNIICIALLLACATKPAPKTVAEASSDSCSLTNAANCKPTAKVAETPEIKPFFESVAPSSVEDTSVKELPLSDEVAQIDGSMAKRSDGVVEFDIPVVVNEDVERWINYFQASGRKYFAAWLSRSGKYIPMMQKILREHNLPQDLVYLSMIESGFKPYAYSRARAMGPWQFIRGTGSRYGLRVDWWIDERRDPEKSTIAAAEHLRDLYDQFNHWYLAAAGYNAGAMKITRAIERYSTEDFWEMSQAQFRYLKPETKNYVPKLLAAAIIAKQPENYGFTGIVYDEPIQYSKVHVPESVELSAVAEALEIDKQDLQDLNPELLRSVTPPNYPDYELKIPVGLDKVFLEKYPEIREKSANRVSKHVVRKGENLGSIARSYGISVQSIMSINNLRNTRIRPGQHLVIPAKRNGRTRTAPVQRQRSPEVSTPAASVQNHKIQKGDTLWSISQMYNVSVNELKNWNQVSSPSEIFPGKTLKIYSDRDSALLHPKSSKKQGAWTSHQVKAGESLWTISRKYGVSLKDLQDWNDLSSGKIFPGKTLKVKAR